MEKMERKVANLLTTSNNSENDSNSKLRLLKLMNFSLFIRPVILNDLRDWNDMEDKR